MLALLFGCSILSLICGAVFARLAPVRGDLRERPRQEDAGFFAATHWSVVVRARDKSEAALGTLCQSYHRPLMVWLRCRGYTVPDAEDLVQGFMAHLLSRDFFNRVTPEKGRFRTFLLKSFQNYIRDRHDAAGAAKRGGGQPLESLDETSGDGKPLHDPAANDGSPDLEYDRAWARTVLANAQCRLEAECAQEGHLALCSALEPVLFADASAAPYQAIAAKLGISEGALKTAAHRLRKRLHWLIRDEVLQTVDSDHDLQAEIRYLIELFAR